MMSEIRSAKLFKNGHSQAVRLPLDFRFDGPEVFIRRDETTGDVILSSSPGAKTWADFVALLRNLDVPSSFMSRRKMNKAPQQRGLFDSMDRASS